MYFFVLILNFAHVILIIIILFDSLFDFVLNMKMLKAKYGVLIHASLSD